MDEVKPHLIVGVDFGMTCTAAASRIPIFQWQPQASADLQPSVLGVSWANPSIGSHSVKWIQKWPGRSQANENKVPTVLVYPSSNDQTPCSWGFLSETAAEQNAEDKEYREWFKTFLDPTYFNKKKAENNGDTPKSIADVEKWYEDYLRLLYRHIEFKLSRELSRTSWQDARIEFLFSVPTTWKPETVENAKIIALRAGFGSGKNHTVTIGLTEAEAAAVHTSIEASGIFTEGDVLLVCDAGGGTTDLSILRVTDTQSESLSLEQLDVVFGGTIGSAAIDFDFEQLVKERLERADRTEKLNFSPEDVAWEMMKSRDFQNTKCEHGGPDDTPDFSVPVPRISPAYVNTTVGLENGEMHFTRPELEKLFDSQITKLVTLIDSQLENMQQKLPYTQVAHLVLSGGLGHSPYVQEGLRSRFGFDRRHSNARNMQIRIAPDPQLAVCKGLVADRVRKLKAGQAILKWRCCRASYGIVCAEVYNPKNPDHIGRKTRKDPKDGKVYLDKVISWFIKKGEPVSADRPIIQNFRRKITPGDPRRTFPTNVIVSYADLAALPYQMSDPSDAQELCEVQSDLSTADERKFKEKNRHFWNTGERYLRAEYQVKVVIGPADIRFELWFEGQKLSKDQSIRVEWVASSAPQAEKSGLHEDALLVKGHGQKLFQ